MKLCASFNIECAHCVEEPLGVSRIHGHSYVVRVCVASRHDEPTSLPALQSAAATIQASLDHRKLNDVLKDQPTMEAIVQFVRMNWRGPDLCAVSVSRPTLGVSAEWEA